MWELQSLNDPEINFKQTQLGIFTIMSFRDFLDYGIFRDLRRHIEVPLVNIS